jgi:beta-N-acetylhexosaminidase
VELAPYKTAIPKGYMNCIMTAHIHFPAWEPQPGVPATLSKRILTGLLRNRLGYKGLIATDSLRMRAVADKYPPGELAVRAVEAGCDILLTSDVESVARDLSQAVLDGRISKNRLDRSVTRILQAKVWAGLYDQKLADLSRIGEIVGCTEHKKTAAEVAQRSVTLLHREGMPLDQGISTLVVSSAGWNDLGPSHPEADGWFIEAVNRYMSNTRNLTIKPDSPEDFLKVERLANEKKQVILGLSSKIRSYTHESKAANQRLIEIIQTISSMNRKMAVVIFGNPYFISELPETPVLICAYSNCNNSIVAATKVLFGQEKATGRLPVTASEKYSFGLGLS